MSLSGALSVALSGLQASSAAVQVVSGNITNSQTEGYTSKSLTLSTIMTGAGQGGIQISGYTRATNSVLAATLNKATSNSSYLGTQSNYLSQVQAILDSTSTPPALSSNLSEFQAAWTQYASTPNDTTLRANVLASAEVLTQTINNIAEEISELDFMVKTELSTAVSSMNEALKQLQTLNTQIATALAGNQSAVDLQDKRDQVVTQIASYTTVKVMERSNGQIALYTTSGTALLDGEAQAFSVSADGRSILNASGSDVTSSLSGGSLQAQTAFLSTTVTAANGVAVTTKLKSQLQNYVNMFIATTSGGGSFADIYNAALAEAGELETSFFVASIDPDGLPDLSSFSVNPDLVAGNAFIKAASATGVSELFDDIDIAIATVDEGGGSFSYSTGNSFSSEGLSLMNQTFSGIAVAILSGFQQAANTMNTQYETAAAQQSYYKSALSGQTGVNTDSELINLTTWQNSYAASAHVISTIQRMMDILATMVD